MKKYELTDETKVEHGVTLHRIRALVDIVRYGVKAGDLGGWIESEANLSQEHEAWVSGEARAYQLAADLAETQIELGEEG